MVTLFYRILSSRSLSFPSFPAVLVELSSSTQAIYQEMPIVHVVQFGFKQDASPKDVDEIVRGMLALQDNCVHPTTQEKYIKSATGGRDTSPEGIQGGITHVFISEFENEEDRRYYLEKDPAHLKFVEALKEVVQTVRVVDFEPGKF
ncbi:hypothetical protein C8Q74DRAFT_1235440 [Fomes fomentarius]|nr:hypothetical protein C8Q74DRAFT_1235440 [Fomes fomentarius]